MGRMLLAEELMLLLLDDEKGTMPAAASMQIDTLLGGALLDHAQAAPLAVATAVIVPTIVNSGS